MAYFILTGQDVFDGATAMHVVSKHLNEAPVPPARRLGRPLSEDLEAVILACLAKDPEARPDSATELREALLACRDAATYDVEASRRWWREHGAAHRMSARLVRRRIGTTMAVDLNDRPGA